MDRAQLLPVQVDDLSAEVERVGHRSPGKRGNAGSGVSTTFTL